MAPTQAPLKVVTVQTGHRYPDLWVSRLAAMVARQLGEPHRFIVYTDRPEPDRFGEPIASHQQLVQQDLEAGSLRGYFSKLRLFDQALTGSDPFLFLDSTLVIRADLAPLVELGRNASASLMGVRDWNYPILNSSVLWCRPDAHTQAVWQCWQEGRYAGAHFAGDQNFIFRVFQELAPAALAYWPAELVRSYKVLRKLASRDAAAAQSQLEACTILKFHGRPKPEEVLHPWRHPRRTILRHPLQPKLWGYLAGEIRNHWH